MAAKTFYMVSLGCAKNLVDSEEMAGLLVCNGYHQVNDPYKADVLVLNTCAFIREAVEETIDHIVEFESIKFKRPETKLVVLGCFVQRYGKKLKHLFPTVDLLLGTGYFQKLPEHLKLVKGKDVPFLAINRPVFRPNGPMTRVLSTVSHAYIKITEGCSNRCSFCLIPKLRGPLRSRPAKFIVEEAREIATKGIMEIVLVGQDTTAYGFDLGKRNTLMRLLERLSNIDNVRWIRLMYCNPSGITDELLQFIKENEKVLPYLDIPIQHVVPRILEAMNRNCVAPERLVERIRTILPDVILRTSLIVGFPGENTRDHKRLLRFVERTQFDRLGVFEFSPEEGTPAYGLKPRVRKSTAARRRDEILTLQAEISLKKHQNIVGTVQDGIVDVLPGGKKPGRGRLWSQAPEVDGEIVFKGTEGTRVGKIVSFVIEAAHTYDFEGRISYPENTRFA